MASPRDPNPDWNLRFRKSFRNLPHNLRLSFTIGMSPQSMASTKNKIVQAKTRVGFTLLESIMAIGFLSVAMTAMLRVNQSLQAYDSRSHQRLVHSVVLDNLVDQLKSSSHTERETLANQNAAAVGAKVSIRSFTHESLQGIHFQFSLGEGSARRTRHLWSFEPGNE